MKVLGGCHCGFKVVEAPTVNLTSGGIEPAQPGDFLVCSACGDVLIFDAGERREWRPANILEVLSAAPFTRAMLARCSKAVRAAAAAVPGRGVGGMRN